ncbi:MAG: alpha/beta fold hydrolase, partial [Gaiellaceae bacterium]
MATFALIHGGGGSAWDWHLVVPELRELGHDPVAVDLPCEDESAGWREYADAVVDAVGERQDVIVVGHSLGGFTAPLVTARVPVSGLVLVAAMVPRPGETGSEWWSASGYEAAVKGTDMPDDEVELFYNRTPPELV